MLLLDVVLPAASMRWPPHKCLARRSRKPSRIASTCITMSRHRRGSTRSRRPSSTTLPWPTRRCGNRSTIWTRPALRPQSYLRPRWAHELDLRQGSQNIALRAMALIRCARSAGLRQAAGAEGALSKQIVGEKDRERYEAHSGRSSSEGAQSRLTTRPSPGAGGRVQLVRLLCRRESRGQLGTLASEFV